MNGRDVAGRDDTRSWPIEAVLFDMDGVVTDTASAHAAAWKQLFDEFLHVRAGSTGEPLEPFDIDRDYRQYVDGKPRYDGVKSFLESRGIDLPWGSELDGPEAKTICGLGNRKNRLFSTWLSENRVSTFPGTLALIRCLRRAGVKTAVFSSSRNAEPVLRSAGALDLFDARVDGEDMARLGLPGKPHPAILQQAAECIGARRERTAVIEDAISGVQAGVRGGFVPTIGVARESDAADLTAAGAHAVVHDLSELAYDAAAKCLFVKSLERLPSVWSREAELRERLEASRAIVFLDYDGTLTPIVEDPDRALLGASMRETLARLANRYVVAVVSGRDLQNVRALVGLDTVYYAGSHGFDMAGPEGWRTVLESGKARLADLDRAESELRDALGGVDGVIIERKAFSIAVHFRKVRSEDIDLAAEAVRGVMSRYGSLRTSTGKKVFDIKPRGGDKGRAVLWLLDEIGLTRAEMAPLYIGDDVTDEDAFRALAAQGIGVVVRAGDARATAAQYALDGPQEVERFLHWLLELDGQGGER
jgi:trehalose 6-phosphate phosphatase